MAPDPNPATRFEWERAVLALPLPSSTKFVGLALAVYCDARNGSHAHPGEDRLAENCCLSDRVVRRHLKTLRHLGLLHRTYKGRANQYRRTADEYALALPASVLEHVDRWLTAGGEELCCRTLASASKASGTGRQSAVVPDAGGLGTGRQSAVVPDAGVRPSTTDHRRVSITDQSSSSAAYLVGDRAREARRICEHEKCNHDRFTADGICMRCHTIQSWGVA
jgi:DNA-binding transcriptional ArsR family regulator